jgi:hypothetical protein
MLKESCRAGIGGFQGGFGSGKMLKINIDNI